MATNVSDPAARQYAKALLQIGQEKNMVERIFDELEAIDQAYRSDKTFRNFFTSPKIPATVKKEIIDNSFGKDLSDVVNNFLGLLIRKRREPLLDNIMDSFARYRDEAENRVHVAVESATELGASEKAELEKSIGKATGKTVVMHTSVKEELIGGVRVRIGDKLLDNSLARRLRELSANLVGEDAGSAGGASREDVEELYARVTSEAVGAA